MPKATRVRETENALGQKINQVMAEKGIAGDYAELARVFGVATPSTYDWVTHGRLGKERYQKLVEWSGRSLDWWFDIATEGSTSLPSESVVSLASKDRWPLATDLETLRRMPPADRDLVDAYIRGLLDARKVDARAKQQKA